VRNQSSRKEDWSWVGICDLTRTSAGVVLCVSTSVRLSVIDVYHISNSLAIDDRTNTTLTRLSLRSNRIGDAGAVALAGALHVRRKRLLVPC
jgi:hypothetical protein